MSQFYTRTGDDGYTGLLGEGRVPKYHPRMEAIGTIDEASAALGVARAGSHLPQVTDILLAVQRDLYHIMAEIAAMPANAQRFRVVQADRVAWLEYQIDALTRQVEIPGEFILPGDSPCGASLALARTTVRRAERRVAELVHTDLLENMALLHYLNRLSSLAFLLELLENQAAGSPGPTIAKESAGK
jgi:cob(I)alamin adenosyltransferase